MSRWAERLKSRYGQSEIPEIPERTTNPNREADFGSNGNFGPGIPPEIAPRQWADHDCLEHDAWLAGTPAAELASLPRTAVTFWVEGDDLYAPGRSATVPGELSMVGAADWLNGRGLGPVIIIKESARVLDFSRARDPVERKFRR